MKTKIIGYVCRHNKKKFPPLHIQMAKIRQYAFVHWRSAQYTEELSLVIEHQSQIKRPLITRPAFNEMLIHGERGSHIVLGDISLMRCRFYRIQPLVETFQKTIATAGHEYDTLYSDLIRKVNPPYFLPDESFEQRFPKLFDDLGYQLTFAQLSNELQHY